MPLDFRLRADSSHPSIDRLRIRAAENAVSGPDAEPAHGASAITLPIDDTPKRKGPAAERGLLGTENLEIRTCRRDQYECHAI